VTIPLPEGYFIKTENVSAMQTLGMYRKWSLARVRTESTMFPMRSTTFSDFMERAREYAAVTLASSSRTYGQVTFAPR
jgi:hypothetical protein